MWHVGALCGCVHIYIVLCLKEVKCQEVQPRKQHHSWLRKERSKGGYLWPHSVRYKVLHHVHAYAWEWCAGGKDAADILPETLLQQGRGKHDVHGCSHGVRYP